MNKFELQKLRELPIEGVARRLGLKVDRHKTLCPFHDDRHPSLSFHPAKNSFRCFSCGHHGDVIALAMQVLAKDFKDTCRWLADEHCIIISECDPHCQPERSGGPECRFEASRYEKFFERPFLNQAAKHFLFDERKLDARVIRWCRLNSWTDRQGTPWLQIPYFDAAGRLIGVQNRRLTLCHPVPDEETGHMPPRFRFPKGSRCRIYNLPVLNRLQPGEELWIAEGCSDCWALLSAGKKAIAIPSATLLKPKDLEVLMAQGTALDLHMAPDRDAPGEKLFHELKELLPNLVRHSLPPGCKDYAEWYLSKC